MKLSDHIPDLSSAAKQALFVLIVAGIAGYSFPVKAAGGHIQKQYVPHTPPAEDADEFFDVEPGAGDNPASTTTTTTTTTMPSSQKVVEVPSAQPPAMTQQASPGGAGQQPSTPPAEAATTTTTTTTTTAAPTGNASPQTAAPPALTAPADSFPTIGGVAGASGTPTVPGTDTGGPGSLTGTSSSPIGALPTTAKPAGSDTYYDAGVPPPPGMATVVGPRKINPSTEPAMKFIIVNGVEGKQGASAQIVAANRALKLGQYEAAAAMFETLYAKNHRDPRILMGRAVALQNTGKPELAMKTYDQLLSIDHNNTEALVNMLGLLRKQYPEVALRRLVNLHEKYPDNAMIAAQIGVTAADQGRFDDALRFLGMATSMEPNNAQHQFNMAVVLDHAGNKKDALKYYEQALETDAVYGGSRSVPRDQIYDRVSVLRRH